MIERADAGVPVGQLAAIGLVVVDEFRKRGCRNRWMHRERERRDRDVGYRFKVLERIVKGPRLQYRFGHMRARATEQKRVAVGR